MDILKEFGVNEDLAQDGVWFNLGQGTKIKMAHADETNPRFAAALQRWARKHKVELQTGKMDEGDARKVMLDVFIECIILDWEGMNFDGEELQFSADNIRKVLGVPKFFRMIQELAMKHEAFGLDVSENSLGNS